MKITKSQLKQIIKEELLQEDEYWDQFIANQRAREAAEQGPRRGDFWPMGREALELGAGLAGEQAVEAALRGHLVRHLPAAARAALAASPEVGTLMSTPLGALGTLAMAGAAGYGGYKLGKAATEYFAPDYADPERGGLGGAAEGGEYETSMRPGEALEADALSYRRTYETSPSDLPQAEREVFSQHPGATRASQLPEPARAQIQQLRQGEPRQAEQSMSSPATPTPSLGAPPRGRAPVPASKRDDFPYLYTERVQRIIESVLAKLIK